MIRALTRHFRDAFQGITRHFAMSVSSASAVTGTLILMSILLLLIGNISQITTNLQESVSIFVRVDESVADTSLTSLQNQIASIDGVKSVTYSSKDNELDKLIAEYGEDGKMFESYRGEENPLSRAFIVEIQQGQVLSDISRQIGRINGIQEALFGGTSTEQFIKTLSMVRYGGFGIVVLLCLLAVFLISNTIKITITARNEEISIMRYVGATNGYVRTPFVIEGMFIGLLGAIIPVIVTIFGYSFLYDSMGGKLITGMLELKPVYPFAIQISGVIVVFGILVGLFGSMISVNKNLRWKR